MPTPVTPSDLQDVVAAVATGDEETVTRFVDLLLSDGLAGDRPLARDTLAELARQPRAVLRLDQALRREAWHPGHSPAWRAPWPDEQAPIAVDGPAYWQAEIRRRMVGQETGPIAVVLASMHPDGRIREKALRHMVKQAAAWTPFITLRTTDWVRPVRDLALLALVDRLLADPARHLRPAAELVFCIPDRQRARTARFHVAAAIDAAPRAVLAGLRESPVAALRRTAFRAGTWPGTALDVLVRVAEGDPDSRLRRTAAEIAAREALWTGRTDLLGRLAAASHASVRAVGLTALMRAGDPGPALAALDDASPLIRATARDVARRQGVDVLAHYRAALSGDAAPAPGALAGLAETGGRADAPLVAAWLRHPEPMGRVRALQALGRLEAQPPDAVLLELFADPSAAVVRAATAALLPRAAELPVGPLEAALGDTRRARRIGAVRLLRAKGGSALHAAELAVRPFE